MRIVSIFISEIKATVLCARIFTLHETIRLKLVSGA